MKEIKKIIAAYNQVDWKSTKAAIGTVVKVEGSSYRRIGARIFVQNDGQWIGGISGGCLEGDALRQAQKVINNNEPAIVTYDTREDDPHQLGVGLGCNGLIEVLFTPIDGNDVRNQIEFLKSIVDSRTSHLLVQVIGAEAKHENSLGQFYLEKDIPALASDFFLDEQELKKAISYAYHKRKSKAFSITNQEGRSIEFVAEIIHPKIKLVCVGDNYDVIAMLEIAKTLDWEVHIVGRKRKLTKQIYDLADQVHELSKVDNISIDTHTAVVLMSHDYNIDFSILKQLLQHKEIPYLGLLGPKKRMLKIENQLQAEGIDLKLDDLSYIHGPVGLDIGAETPEEIAVSIVAEVIAHLRGRNGSKLRLRKGTIYGNS